MIHLPAELSLAFILVTLLTIVLFRRAIQVADGSRRQPLGSRITAVIVLWLGLQAALSLSGIYTDHPDALPPRIALFGVLPTIIVILFTFSTTGGRQFVDSLPLFEIHSIHTVRLFVELVLWWLFLNGAVPELMTFEGRNLDIVAGLTAPFIAYYGIVKKTVASRAIIIWNIVCLGLLFNIVSIAILSVPSPVQRLAFDQPNVAVLVFPFSWLPTFVVPVVLFSHLVAIRQLTRRGRYFSS